MIKKADKAIYICAGFGIVDAIVLSFFLGVKKGDNDCLKSLIEKNDSLNF